MTHSDIVQRFVDRYAHSASYEAQGTHAQRQTEDRFQLLILRASFEVEHDSSAGTKLVYAYTAISEALPEARGEFRVKRDASGTRIEHTSSSPQANEPGLVDLTISLARESALRLLSLMPTPTGMFDPSCRPSFPLVGGVSVADERVGNVECRRLSWLHDKVGRHLWIDRDSLAPVRTSRWQVDVEPERAESASGLVVEKKKRHSLRESASASPSHVSVRSTEDSVIWSGPSSDHG